MVYRCLFLLFLEGTDFLTASFCIIYRTILSEVCSRQRCQVVPAHLVKCCIQSLEDWDVRWFLLCPHEDGQEQRLSSASIAFQCLRQVHDPSAGTHSALDKTQSTLRSCFEYSFLSLLASPFLDSSCTGTATFSKQMATTSFRMSALSTRRTFIVKVKKKCSELGEYRKLYLTINC